MPTREMTREELLNEYLLQRQELNSLKKEYSKLISYVVDYLYDKIKVKTIRKEDIEEMMKYSPIQPLEESENK